MSSLPFTIGMILIIGGVALANSQFGQRRRLGRRAPNVAGGARAESGD